VSEVLDRHPEILELVAADLIDASVAAVGRTGLSIAGLSHAGSSWLLAFLFALKICQNQEDFLSILRILTENQPVISFWMGTT